MNNVLFTIMETLHIINSRFPDYLAPPQWFRDKTKGRNKKVNAYSYDIQPVLILGVDYRLIGGTTYYTRQGLTKLIAIREQERQTKLISNS